LTYQTISSDESISSAIEVIKTGKPLRAQETCRDCVDFDSIRPSLCKP